jgi:hypothetical protein
MKMLEKNVIEMLVGCLLGDAHIARSGGKAYITFEQTLKHRAYVMHIKDVLKGAGGIDLYDIKYYKRTDSRYNSVNESIYLKTHSSELLSFLAEMFLSDGNKKILPFDIEKYLSPIALAY